MKLFWALILCLVHLCVVNSFNKYSEEANAPFNDDFLTLEKPFRMNKVNLVWTKAKQRLGPEKLRNLAKDLITHDKLELTLKKIKAEGLDKQGLKEADIRKKFHNIMDRYNLLKHMDSDFSGHQPKAFNEPHDMNKAIFKDKKLNKLWQKAEELNEFSIDQLMTLKQEFRHHEEKLDEYYHLLNELHAENISKQEEYDNTIDQYLNSERSKSGKSMEERVQAVREKHVDLKKEFEKLNDKAIPDGAFSPQDFKDPKVKILWKLARDAGFEAHELVSLKEELEHYEQRVIKLNHLEAELTIMNEKHVDNRAKDDTRQHLSKKVKQLSHKVAVDDCKIEVNKLHHDLESRIKERHTEL